MISFAAPWALLGLLAAAIPILLHLAQRRQPPEVAFPAVQYLDDATREHRRRLKLRHWLLLAVRTLLIVTLVLAAAGMRLRRGRLGGHPPAALVLVVDNSASSSAMVDGTPILTALVAAAREVLGHATEGDRLWLVTADGIARPGNGATLRSHLEQLRPTAIRLDLGAAIVQGRELIRGSGLSGEVVVVSDLQRSALEAAPGSGAILALHPDLPATGNHSIAQLEPIATPWGAAGGDVRLTVASRDTTPVPVNVGFLDGSGAHRDLLVTPGVPVTVHLQSMVTGWHTLVATTPPDEYRLDDTRAVAIQVAPPAVVRWDPTDRFLDAALDVLVRDGRLRPGEAIRVGSLGPGPSVVVPPADAAQLGALNRALAARGVPWQYGTVLEEATLSDSTPLLGERVRIARRVTLRPTGASGEVLLTVAGEPWLVRGEEMLLLGSRFDPSWTDLPLSAGFVPLLDALVTRIIRGAPAAPVVAAGSDITLPGTTTRIAHDSSVISVEGGAPWRPESPGVYHLLAGGDTLGTVSAHLDPRESDLAVANEADVVALWPDAIVASLNGGPALAFGTARGDLRKSLLLLALVCLIAETLLARRGARLSA